ncbi:hypothetical protein [Coraliomargarita parva]|uniref:hypothetical protein n=1 Tax=Coraliomargarita parva TaxID=3014050 RepID=UPI0022B30379|nr:hypothetical protein [Coraliomargarita parva]
MKDLKPVESKETEAKPGFFQRIFTKMDHAMKTKADEKAKSGCCCSGDDKGKGGKCC